MARFRRRHWSSGGTRFLLGSDLAEPDRDDVPNLDRVERLADASHWVHHDEAERVNQRHIDFFPAAVG
jgi:pimeloyl-ACP methyl ester carboxylesterase